MADKATGLIKVFYEGLHKLVPFMAGADEDLAAELHEGIGVHQAMVTGQPAAADIAQVPAQPPAGPAGPVPPQE